MDAVADGGQGNRRQGRELAIYQAADAFELFTGLKPPSAPSAMRSTP